MRPGAHQAEGDAFRLDAEPGKRRNDDGDDRGDDTQRQAVIIAVMRRDRCLDRRVGGGEQIAELVDESREGAAPRRARAR